VSAGPGLGGMNPAPQDAPPPGGLGLGVQPGVNNGIVIANVVIVFGPDAGVFIYATGTTPGPGNPPVLWMTDNTTDPYGNTLIPGIGSSTGGTFPRQMIMNEANLEATPGGLLAGSFANLAAFEAPDGTAEWSTSDLYNDVPHYVGQGINAPFAANWGNFGHGGENLNYWQVPSPANEVRLNGIVTPAAGAGTTLFTLPGAYIPLFTQVITGSNVTTGGAIYWLVNATSGTVVLGGGGLVAGDEYTVNGGYNMTY
jgi:hypothetical protein